MYSDHWTWDDIGTDAFPFEAFKSFVLYAQPGTAIFHQLNQGWHVGDHLAAFQLDVLNRLWWAKTEDGQKNRNRPEPTPRPGMATVENEKSEFAVSVEAYLRMVAEWEERED